MSDLLPVCMRNLTPEDARKILANPLKFGDELQIQAKKILEPVDFPLTFDNVLAFINEWPYHKARMSPGWSDILDALNGIEAIVREEIRDSI